VKVVGINREFDSWLTSPSELDKCGLNVWQVVTARMGTDFLPHVSRSEESERHGTTVPLKIYWVSIKRNASPNHNTLM
jgi:hypothetical protein